MCLGGLSLLWQCVGVAVPAINALAGTGITICLFHLHDLVTRYIPEVLPQLFHPLRVGHSLTLQRGHTCKWWVGQLLFPSQTMREFGLPPLGTLTSESP